MKMSCDDVSFVLTTFAGAVFFLPCGVALALNWILATAGMEIELIRGQTRASTRTPVPATESRAPGEVEYMVDSQIQSLYNEISQHHNCR